MESSVAIIIPCLNEVASIADVVESFQEAVPAASIYVYDNGSTDGTAEVASGAGAIIRTHSTKGKGGVVRRMFSDVEADIYVMVDGDNTYDASALPEMIALLQQQSLDMVVGAREPVEIEVWRPGHEFGNRLLSGLVASIFGNRFTDLLSGYRVLSKRFVKTFPSHSGGFEIETEMTIHALEMQIPFVEIKTRYAARHETSESKLNTYRDGARILRTIIQLIREERPFAFFGSFSLLFAISSISLGAPVIVEFMNTGLVPRFPTAILATGLAILSALSFFASLILDSIRLGRLETKRLAYLTYRPSDR
jgi:glycosyltransferase involved in cell wall biosynthesis